MTRIGIFEGSFNPPHKGHVEAARAFMEQMWLDFLYVVPLAREGESRENATDRLKMCELAFSEIDGVYVSDAALTRATYSTADAARALSEGDDRRVFLLYGTDRMLSLDEREDVAELFRYAYPAYVRCEKDPSVEPKIIAKNTEYHEKYGKIVRRILTEPQEISSEEIRNRVKNGAPIDGTVSRMVEKYIRDNHLYD